MNNDESRTIDVTEPKEIVVADRQRGMALDVKAVNEMKEQRELLKDYVQSQLREASFKDMNAIDYSEGDYGKIPGTKKNTLLKAGAEKLLRLFRLGARFTLVDKTVNADSNYASFSYKCTIYSLVTGDDIAESDASANSYEKKWKTRTEWKNNQKVTIEQPIWDVMNTLQKMAQKRSLVSAVLLATGASEYFFVDIEDLPQPDPKDPKDFKPQVAAPLPRPRQTNSVPPGSVSKPASTRQNTSPGADSLTSEFNAPTHCSVPMSVNKLNAREWFCIKCGHKEERK